MALKRLKTKQSKRQTCKLKYKIKAKIREHTRKTRKESRKTKGKSGKSKMIQIPNICPFKEEILKDIAIVKKDKEDERLRQHERWRIEREEKKKLTLEEMAKNAEDRGDIHTILADNAPKPEKLIEEAKDMSLKAYFKEFKKVIEAADVILEVVDARDPLGTRCLEVSQAVKATKSKRLILVLNKADLVPRENLNKWLKYLRTFGPTTAFKASTQQQNLRLGRRKYQLINTLSMKGGPCVGAELLMSMLANYCRSNDIKTSIRVGVVGIPNVGKSSIINSLKRRRACGVGATPGVTRAMQEIEIDSHIKLLDSPGVVFSHPRGDPASFQLKNAQKVTNIRDPYESAKAVLQRGTKSYFCKLYNISEYDTPEEFLARLAQSKGKIKKGGVPDMLNAAHSVVHDWNSGKIKYCTHPPEESSDTSIHLSATIIHQDNVREFEIDNFEEMETEILNNFIIKQEDVTEIISTGPVKLKIDPDDEDELNKIIGKRTKIYDDNNDEDMDEETVGKKKKSVVSKKKKNIDPAMELQGNLMLNKQRKEDVKKLKKLKNKNERKLSNVTDVLEGFSFGSNKKEDTTDSNTDEYDFETDLVMKE